MEYIEQFGGRFPGCSLEFANKIGLHFCHPAENTPFPEIESSVRNSVFYLEENNLVVVACEGIVNASTILM